MRAIAVTFFLFCFVFPAALAQLKFGFYSRSCPHAESIVANVVAKHFRRDRSIAADLVRMHFHDCFVKGCDASLLIDPKPGRPSEKNAGPNASVDGYEIIDEAKKQLEAHCPHTVSCADVVTLATRDAVTLAGGLRYAVPTGRRDSLRSNPADVNLPGPTIPVTDAIQAFGAVGLNLFDMVTLVIGGHTIGVIHCSLIQDRIADPAMERTLNAKLRNQCRAPNDPTVFLDQRTSFKVDNGLCLEVLRQRGVLRIDQSLGLDGRTRGIIMSYAKDNALFNRKFAQALVKMGTRRFLSGRAGEIRKNCRVFNNGH
ncbi:PREDICTED: peroxidase 44-like [Tarenaya hassleriana]|uniref:peroxidase 44-like n=1 Tax=Tarenaya hassleriana TaxID=28532 RepID=UPI00053C39FC|nr:PREDICTED: peroxidase 44-like [Tarenaya hassleriana]